MDGGPRQEVAARLETARHWRVRNIFNQHYEFVGPVGFEPTTKGL